MYPILRTVSIFFSLITTSRAYLGILSVLTSAKDCVHDHDKVKEKPAALSRANDLAVWKTKGTMIINKSFPRLLPEILRKIDVDNKNHIEKPSVREQVAELRLSDGQILLVRLPGMSCIFTAVGSGCILI